jgi:signal transduction histidine kinase
MSRRVSVGLASKVIFGFIFISLIAVSITCFSIFKLQKIEKKMELVNAYYVPALTVVNRLEGHFRLLEEDIASVAAGAPYKLLDNPLQMSKAKLEYLNRISATSEQMGMEVSHVTELLDAFAGFELALQKQWSEKNTPNSNLVTSTKADFSHRLHVYGRDLDRQVRMSSVELQKEIGEFGVLLTFVIALTLIVVACLVFWIRRRMLPLQQLTEKIKAISTDGLQEDLRLFTIKNAKDEVNILIEEFNKMSVVLLQRNQQMEAQRLNLERAYQELKKQNADLLEAKEKLLHQEKLALIGRLSAQMAHEIRNPLNALGLHLEYLSDLIKDSKSDYEETLASVKREVERLMSITSSYLNITKKSSRRTESFSLKQLVDEVVNLYRPVMHEKKIDCLIDHNIIPEVTFDRKELFVVFGNLIKNAVDAFDREKLIENRRQIKILTKKTDAGFVDLICADNGSGIEEGASHNIFDPFFTTKAEGTGLGLATSKQIVDAQGGYIFFETKPGHGTAFTLKLPIAGE